MLDDALVPPNTDLYGNSNRVSILVVMDDALVQPFPSIDFETGEESQSLL